MANPTDAQHDYMHDLLGVDPRAFSAKEKAPAGKALALTIPLPGKTIKAVGGRIDITLQFIIQVYATVSEDGVDQTKVDVKGLAKGVGKFLLGWRDTVALPSINGGGGLFKSLKVGVMGAGLGATAATDTEIGRFSLQFMLVKLGVGGAEGGVKLAFRAVEASVSLAGRRVKLPDTEIDGIKLTNVILVAGGQVSLAPNWPVVLGKIAAQEAGEAVLAQAGEVAATVVSAEVIIAGSLIAVGLTTIFGTLYSLAQGSQIGDLAVSVRPGIVQAKQGFKLAMQGYRAPADPLGAAGYQAGEANWAALIAKVQKAFPDAEENEIKRQIAGVADAAVTEAGATIERAVRVALWDGYLKKNQAMLLSGDARWAFTACFGDNPGDSDPEWKKYLAQHSMGSKI